ncbi:hypothetical protein KTF36_04430 [Burkholderia gladioli]|nr:hypothetical protein [Burkholderia gladioli]MBU9641097.1 hypothetical protein [Burkholderia gladioli]
MAIIRKIDIEMIDILFPPKSIGREAIDTPLATGSAPIFTHSGGAHLI